MWSMWICHQTVIFIKILCKFGPQLHVPTIPLAPRCPPGHELRWKNFLEGPEVARHRSVPLILWWPVMKLFRVWPHQLSALRDVPTVSLDVIPPGTIHKYARAPFQLSCLSDRSILGWIISHGFRENPSFDLWYPMHWKASGCIASCPPRCLPQKPCQWWLR